MRLISNLTAVVCMTVALAAGTSPASGQNNLVPVTPGINAAAVPGAVPFGSTPASTPETV